MVQGQGSLHPDASAPVRHIPALDGLRGLAALIVAVSHLSAMTGIAVGFFGSARGQLGVILFFALSGFLMAHMYFEAPFSPGNLGRFAVAHAPAQGLRDLARDLPTRASLTGKDDRPHPCHAPPRSCTGWRPTLARTRTRR